MLTSFQPIPLFFPPHLRISCHPKHSPEPKTGRAGAFLPTLSIGVETGEDRAIKEK